MPLAKSLRDQDLNWAAHEFVSIKPEQPFGLGVHKRDFSCGIHDDHGIRCGFEELLRKLLRGFSPGKVILIEAS